MDNSAEVGSDFFGTNVLRQLMLAKTSTLVLMTIGLLLFVTLVAKRVFSKQEVTSLLNCRPTGTYWFVSFA